MNARFRMAAWALVVPVICLGGRLAQAQAATPAPSAGPSLWPLIVTPMLTGAIGIVAAFVAIRFDARKTVNQELIKKRIAIYDHVVPKLNELLCFFLTRGSWRSFTPPLMIQRKRELDQTFYVYGPLFSPAVFAQYNVFIHVCFETFTGVGHDARLRADHERLKREWGAGWLAEWDNHLADPGRKAADKDLVHEYDTLVALLAGEIGAIRRSADRNAARSRR